jgi:hypothetical protein
MPSTRQTSRRAAILGSTPAASSPDAWARAVASVIRVSIVLKKRRMRCSTSGLWAANSMAVATTRHPRLPALQLVRST